MGNYSPSRSNIHDLTGSGGITYDTSTLHLDDDNNRVGIGTTSPSAKLTVYDNVPSGMCATFLNDGNNANRYGIIIQCGVDNTSQGGGSNADSLWATLKGGSGTSLSYITYTTSSPYAAFSAGSDKRIKRDIAPTKVEGLKTLNKLELSEFRWSKDGPTGNLNKIGFIAQNCEEAYPEMVSEVEEEEYDFDVKTVAPAALIPVLVKAIQELSNNNQELATRITELENK